MIEETALRVDKVPGGFEELHWTSCSSMTRNVQMNFAVTVAQPAVLRLNLEEHIEHEWATEERAAALPATEAMKKVFADAFAFARENGIGG